MLLVNPFVKASDCSILVRTLFEENVVSEVKHFKGGNVSKRSAYGSVKEVVDKGERLELLNWSKLAKKFVRRDVRGFKCGKKKIHVWVSNSAKPLAFVPPHSICISQRLQKVVQQYGDIDVFTTSFRPLKVTLYGLLERVFMKLVIYAKTNEVLGLHVRGEDAPEIVQGFAIAIKAGLTKADFDATVAIHPSAAEEFVIMRTPTRKI
ncbi:Glutathione reductase [Spatholobus suberectus]|nr:Glutathione reductase [Spatholobus suberectus]